PNSPTEHPDVRRSFRPTPRCSSRSSFSTSSKRVPGQFGGAASARLRLFLSASEGTGPDAGHRSLYLRELARALSRAWKLLKFPQKKEDMSGQMTAVRQRERHLGARGPGLAG